MNQRMAVLCLLLGIVAACSTLPSSGPDGSHRDVVISDRVEPRDIRARVGEEIRMSNRRTRPVWIYFDRDVTHELSCKSGLTQAWGPAEIARIKPGKSARLCFRRPGEYGYVVQLQPASEGGARSGELLMPAAVPGVILVEE